MKRCTRIVCLFLLGTLGAAEMPAEETLDTLLPPPGWFRRHAEQLNIDAQTRQRIEQMYKEKEPKYHQLKYKVERLANQLYPALIANELSEESIVNGMKSLLKAENELKLYQVHVRVSLLSQVSSEQRQAARALAKQEPPATNWRGGVTAKVERVRELSKRLQESGRSITEIEKRMKEVDETIAAGNVDEGFGKLDQVIRSLEESLAK